MVAAFTARGVHALGASSPSFHVAVEVGLKERAVQVCTVSVCYSSAFSGCTQCCQTAWEVHQGSDPQCIPLPGLHSDPRELLRPIQKRDLRDTHLEIVKNTRAASRMEAREEKTSCLPPSANLLSAPAEQRCWFTWEPFYSYVGKMIPLFEERTKGWEGLMSLHHTRISHTFISGKNCSSRFSIFSWHQTI